MKKQFLASSIIVLICFFNVQYNYAGSATIEAYAITQSGETYDSDQYYLSPNAIGDGYVYARAIIPPGWENPWSYASSEICRNSIFSTALLRVFVDSRNNPGEDDDFEESMSLSGGNTYIVYVYVKVSYPGGSPPGTDRAEAEGRARLTLTW